MARQTDGWLTRAMAFIMAHAKAVLVIILLITIAFGTALPKLKINANIFSYMGSMEPSPYITTPETVPEEPLELEGISYTIPVPERGEVVEMPEREKLA